ncbi:MAG TPA: YciI family protein [Reyranella sp.]|nr:YciI family protein [Reyranella sp.]
MSSSIFAVLRTRGPSWNDAAAMEQQVDWRGHADFMNQLVSEGVILLGGPLTGTRDVLLIVRAGNEAEVDARLAADCWTVNGLLRTVRIDPWWLRLGTLAPSTTPSCGLDTS